MNFILRKKVLVVKTSAMKETQKQYSLPILGLRIFSLFLIYLGHSELMIGGGYGAVFFLVLSGYLFVTQFYLRNEELLSFQFFSSRVKKIYPPLCALLILTITYKWIKGLNIDVVQILAALSFTSNYHNALYGHQQNGLGHLWALAVNMQFCFFFPLLFKWLKTASRIQIALILLGCFSLFYRMILALKGWGSPSYLYNSFETRGDALALGALCAFWQSKEGSQKMIDILQNPFVILKNVTAIFLLGRLSSIDRFVFGQPLMALGYSLLIVQVSRLKFSFLTKSQLEMISVFCLWFYLFHPWGLAIGKKLPLEKTFQTLSGAIILILFFIGFYWGKKKIGMQTKKISPLAARIFDEI